MGAPGNNGERVCAAGTSLPPEDELHGDAFHGRLNEPALVSYAQNAEDVRLHRVFGRKKRGFYIDVGAGHPERDSVTKLFYDAGWSGLNIEPGPLYAELADARPRDVTLELAVSTHEGEADFWVSSPDSGFSGFERLPDELVPEGFSFAHKRIQCARLDALIDEHASGRDIDFLKIDVEGAERDVLSSFDPKTIRPTVILVESISPVENRQNHEEWESLLVDHGYAFAAFDGINRFYVPVEHGELIEALAYPISVLDRYESANLVSERSRASQQVERGNQLQQENAQLGRENATRTRENATLAREKATLTRENATLTRENATLAAHDVGAVAQIRAMEHTVSWRITRPLRSLRGAQLRWVAANRQGAGPGPISRRLRPNTSRSAVRDFEGAFARRLSESAKALSPEFATAQDPKLHEALDALESALHVANVPDRAKAWISLVAVDGVFPGERDVDRVARRLRMEGASAVRSELVSRFDNALARGSATAAQLDVRRDRVVVDVTHTVSMNLHTGIQRVVRETVSRWIDAGRPIDLVHFDFASGSMRLLSEGEYQRLSDWRVHLGRSGAEMSTRVAEEATGDLLVPWRCQFVVPELAAEPQRCSAYRALGSSSVLRSLSLVGYDLIPIVATETVTDGMTANFGRYLSMLKYANRISAISRCSADGFRGFGEMAASEGLPTPEIRAHELPTEALNLTPEAIAGARSTLEIGAAPMILVVGSNEPRKNHLAVLEAAERLWAGGATFELLFIGGSGWKGEEFDELVASLVSVGRPINVRKRCTEEELWAAYSLARFTVFPSLLEGFGLPVAESLASGTPVITSAHGSMAEIAEGGGCLVVDPRDVESLESAMSRLIQDDGLLERLRLEATSRRSATWDDYADELWRFLAESGTS
jgi:FkbM family methyltransferase